MISYVYRVTSKTPINGMIYYVGKRTGELDDLQTGRYKISSKLLRDIFNPNDFFIKIVKVYSTSEEAIKFGIKYHKRLNVKPHNLFFNLANQTEHSSVPFDRSKLVT